MATDLSRAKLSVQLVHCKAASFDVTLSDNMASVVFWPFDVI